MANVASATKFFPTAKEGFNTATSGTVTGGVSTSVGLNSVAGYVTGEVVALVIDPSDNTKKQVFTGVIDATGVQVTNVVWTEGNNVTHVTGAQVVDYETATAWALQAKGILVGHNQDGTHKVFAETNIVPTGAIQASAVTTAKINNGAVTADKLGTGALSAYVVTTDTVTSTTYADPGAPGPAVTVVVGANGILLVNLSGSLANNTAGDQTFMGFALSSGNTLAASDNYAIAFQAYGAGAQIRPSGSFLLTGLTAGSTVVTAKYRVDGGQGTLKERRIGAVPL